MDEISRNNWLRMKLFVLLGLRLKRFVPLFFICFIVCTTRVSPVGIPRDIYRICFYINVFICFIVCTTRVSPVGIPRDIYRIVSI